MLKQIKYLIFAVLLCAIPVQAAEVSGTVETGGKMLFTENGTVVSYFNEVMLELNKADDTGGFYVGLTGLGNDSDFTLGLEQGYVDFFGKNLDLRLGKQRAGLGVAVKFNPTDFVNPANIADPFGERLAVGMVKLDYYLPFDIQFSGIVVPVHHPILKAIPNKPTVPVEQVAPELGNVETMLSLKAVGLLGGDLAVSYFHGFEDLPSVKLGTGGPTGYYRDLQAVGFNAAYPIGDIGFWVEGAYFIPEGTFDNGYLQTVAGTDYRLGNGLYLMGQFIYKEDQMQNKATILQLGTEQAVFELHKLRVGGMYQIETKGFVIMPEVEIFLNDSSVLLLSGNYLVGETPLPTQDNGMRVSIKYNF